MAYTHELTITDRIRVSPSKVIGDDSTQENVIEAVVCIAKCTDDETNEVAFTDPWVSIDLSELTAGNFVAFDDLTGLPTRARTQLEAWGEEQKEGLEAQLAARAIASKEKEAPWAA
jgi:hypothetical protein